MKKRKKDAFKFNSTEYNLISLVLFYGVLLQYQEVLSIYKIECWCELTTAILIWGNVDLCFGQKYTLTSRLGGGGCQNLDVISTFRIEFSICE